MELNHHEELLRWHRDKEDPLTQRPEDLASGLTPIPVGTGLQDDPLSHFQPPTFLYLKKHTQMKPEETL